MKPGGRWLRGACLAAVLLTAPFFHRRLAAQEPTLRLTMDEAVRRALASGEEVHLAQATVDQARGQVRQAYSSALPELRASFAYTRTFASIFSGASGPAISPFEPDTNASLSDRVRYLEDEYPSATARGLGAQVLARRLIRIDIQRLRRRAGDRIEIPVQRLKRDQA